MPTLATDGTIVVVGYLGPLEPPFNSGPLVFHRKSLAGSLIGGIAETQEMLDFCGQHGIQSDVEVIRSQDINEAYARIIPLAVTVSVRLPRINCCVVYVGAAFCA